MTATHVQTQTEWVVFDAVGGILVIFAGKDAYEAARQWEIRGHRIEALRTPAHA